MQKGRKPRRGHEVRGTQVSWATNLRGPDFHPRDDLFQQNFCGLNPGRGRAGSWHAGSWHVEVRGKSIPIAVQLYAVQLYINVAMDLFHETRTARGVGQKKRGRRRA